MKNKYAGVTLDWYDDKGETLKKSFPTLDSLPNIIKTANIKPLERVPADDFGLIFLDEGVIHHKYACYDPGTTAMSVIYFIEHGDKLPEDAQKVAAASLVAACHKFELVPPEPLMKMAGPMLGKGLGVAAGAAGLGLLGYGAHRMWQKRQAEDIANAMAAKSSNQRQVSEKLSSVVDVTGKRPASKIKVAKPMSDNDYAVVLPSGQRFYPINSWDLVKRAEQYFEDEQRRMAPEIRRQFATKLAAKAEQLGYPIQENIKEAGAPTYAAPGHLKAAVEMRKAACAPGESRQFLDGLLKQSSVLAPDIYAECLKRFDVQNGLDRGWDHVIPNPWDSTYGIDKTAEVLWEEGADRMTREQLQNLVENHTSGIQELFSHDFLKEFIKDPEALFSSLPLASKRVMARLADNMSHAGGSEGTVVKNETMRM